MFGTLIFVFLIFGMPIVSIFGLTFFLNKLLKGKSNHSQLIAFVCSYLLTFFLLFFLQSFQEPSNFSISFLVSAYCFSLPVSAVFINFSDSNIASEHARDFLIILIGAFQWTFIFYLMKKWLLRKKALGNMNLKMLFGYLIMAFFLIFMVRASAFLYSNFYTSRNNVVCGEAVSPNKMYVLTVGHPGMLDDTGKTYFYLHRKDDPLKFERRDLLTGDIIQPESNVLVIEGTFFPYGIVWLNDKDLLLDLIHPIDWEYLYYGKNLKMYLLKKEQWNDVKISYGVLGSKKYSNEVFIENH